MNEFRILVADGQLLCRFGLCSPLGSHGRWPMYRANRTDGRVALPVSLSMPVDTSDFLSGWKPRQEKRVQ